MFRSTKKKFDVDLGEMKNEQQVLSDFVKSKLKADVTASGNKISVSSEGLSAEDLKKLINKFLYRRNLNNEYWVALEYDLIKIKKFEGKKHEKNKKNFTQPSTIKHGW